MAKQKQQATDNGQAPTFVELRVESPYELSSRKGTYFTTLDTDDADNARVVRNALETADSGWEAVAGTPLFVTGVVAHKVRTWNQAGTVQDEKLRVILTDAEGRTFSVVHDRAMNALLDLKSVLEAAGDGNPVRVRLEKIGNKRSFRGYRVVDEGIE